MPIFTEGNDPLDHQDAGRFFARSPISAADEARFQHEIAIQRESDHNAAVVGWSVIALIGLLIALAVVLHRRKIARAADAVLVSGLATGVRTARKVSSAKDAFAARVLAKADENPSQPD